MIRGRERETADIVAEESSGTLAERNDKGWGTH